MVSQPAVSLARLDLIGAQVVADHQRLNVVAHLLNCPPEAGRATPAGEDVLTAQIERIERAANMLSNTVQAMTDLALRPTNSEPSL